MKDIFAEIKQAFGSLWKCRKRGGSLEIITPFSTSTDMYVSVFLTQREDAWFVSDGGWIKSGTYNCELPDDDSLFSKILDFYIEENGISITNGMRQLLIYYKGTRRRDLVPNIVMDVASFVSSVITSASIQLRNEKERPSFRTDAKNFLKERISDKYLSFNALINEESSTRFGAIINREPKALTLINFVSASQSENFRRGIAYSNLSFDLLSQMPVNKNVSHKIVLIDDTRITFNRAEMEPSLTLCRSKGQKVLSWLNDKERLIKIASE